MHALSARSLSTYCAPCFVLAGERAEDKTSKSLFSRSFTLNGRGVGQCQMIN